MPPTRDRWPTFGCRRCGAQGGATIVSKYNFDEICIECSKDERALPSFPAADAAEVASVRRGERNYPGVGLSAEDREQLKALRIARS